MIMHLRQKNRRANISCICEVNHTVNNNKLFRTGNINIVRECQVMFQFQLPSELLEKRTKKFIHDYDKFAAPLIYSDAHCG